MKVSNPTKMEYKFFLPLTLSIKNTSTKTNQERFIFLYFTNLSFLLSLFFSFLFYMEVFSLLFSPLSLLTAQKAPRKQKIAAKNTTAFPEPPLVNTCRYQYIVYSGEEAE